jgi:hypothetical protein
MLKFNAPQFYHVTTLLSSLETSLGITWRLQRDQLGEDLIHAPTLDENGSHSIDALAAHLEEIGLDYCAASLRRVQAVMRQHVAGELGPDVAERQIQDFRDRVHDALKEPHFLVLNARERELYEAKASFFGECAETAFADIQHDLEEAAKCLALKRNTAMVFHLMRVMESAVRKLAAKASVIARAPITIHKPNGEFLEWGGILSNLKSQGIDSMASATAKQSWTEVHTLLYAVKEAWRNPTMHPAAKYTDEEADEVFATARVLIRKLASLV